MSTPLFTAAVQQENERLEAQVAALQRGRAELAARLATVEAENRVLRAARDVALALVAWGGQRTKGGGDAKG